MKNNIELMNSYFNHYSSAADHWSAAAAAVVVTTSSAASTAMVDPLLHYPHHPHHSTNHYHSRYLNNCPSPLATLPSPTPSSISNSNNGENSSAFPFATNANTISTNHHSHNLYNSYNNGNNAITTSPANGYTGYELATNSVNRYPPTISTHSPSQQNNNPLSTYSFYNEFIFAANSNPAHSHSLPPANYPYTVNAMDITSIPDNLHHPHVHSQPDIPPVYELSNQTVLDSGATLLANNSPPNNRSGESEKVSSGLTQGDLPLTDVQRTILFAGQVCSKLINCNTIPTNNKTVQIKEEIKSETLKSSQPVAQVIDETGNTEFAGNSLVEDDEDEDDIEEQNEPDARSTSITPDHSSSSHNLSSSTSTSGSTGLIPPNSALLTNHNLQYPTSSTQQKSSSSSSTASSSSSSFFPWMKSYQGKEKKSLLV